VRTSLSVLPARRARGLAAAFVRPCRPGAFSSCLQARRHAQQIAVKKAPAGAYSATGGQKSRCCSNAATFAALLQPPHTYTTVHGSPPFHRADFPIGLEVQAPGLCPSASRRQRAHTERPGRSAVGRFQARDPRPFLGIALASHGPHNLSVSNEVSKGQDFFRNSWSFAGWSCRSVRRGPASRTMRPAKWLNIIIRPNKKTGPWRARPGLRYGELAASKLYNRVREVQKQCVSALASSQRALSCSHSAFAPRSSCPIVAPIPTGRQASAHAPPRCSRHRPPRQNRSCSDAWARKYLKHVRHLRHLQNTQCRACVQEKRRPAGGLWFEEKRVFYYSSHRIVRIVVMAGLFSPSCQRRCRTESPVQQATFPFAGRPYRPSRSRRHILRTESTSGFS
jgi:hypothetical protein